jgi:hypothetical protein
VLFGEAVRADGSAPPRHVGEAGQGEIPKPRTCDARGRIAGCGPRFSFRSRFSVPMGKFMAFELFFDEPLVDRALLRSYAREQVETSPLIRACARGDRLAIGAMHRGFWPFVEGFEKAIDRKVMPLQPLYDRFGQKAVRSYFVRARRVVAEMAEEEGSHAQLWRSDADELGIKTGNEHIVPGVRRLLDGANDRDMVVFFCVLAGTEYIAEELSRLLCSASAFLACFPKRRWFWGKAHLAHHDGPSHLELDEDLARAYGLAEIGDEDDVREHMSSLIEACERTFFEASVEVQEIFSRSSGAPPESAS